MNEPLSAYMKVGIVHFMAWPECMGGDGPVGETVMRIAEDPYFEVLEITTINDPGARDQVRALMEDGRMEVCFGAQPILLGGGLDLNHPNAIERAKAVDAVKEGIDQARAMGIQGVALLSGRVSEDHGEAKGRLTESLVQLCEYAGEGGQDVVLETFDQVPFGKNCLIGPTPDAVEVSEAVRKQCANFGLLLDLSHLPLIGESSAEAIRVAGDHLAHVHIGNCAMDDPAHPAYGDNHPRFGAPGTRNGVAELAEFLTVLLDTGYLNTASRRIVSFEVKPMAGESAEDIIANCKETLNAAWEQV